MRLRSVCAITALLCSLPLPTPAFECRHVFVRWSRAALDVTSRVSGIHTLQECKRACSENYHPSNDRYKFECAGFNYQQISSNNENICELFRDDQLQSIDHDIIAREDYAFYRKYCIQTKTVCDSIYSFDMIVDSYMDFDDGKQKTATAHDTGECLQLCLEEKDFTCRSASFNRTGSSCLLSGHNRFTKPGHVRLNTNPNYRIDYYENNCFNDSFVVTHECLRNGIRVNVEAERPYTGALYGVHNFFSGCRHEPKQESRFSFLFPYESNGGVDCVASMKVKEGDKVLDVVLSTDGVQPLYFVTDQDLLYEARCPAKPSETSSKQKISASIDFNGQQVTKNGERPTQAAVTTTTTPSTTRSPAPTPWWADVFSTSSTKSTPLRMRFTSPTSDVTTRQTDATVQPTFDAVDFLFGGTGRTTVDARTTTEATTTTTAATTTTRRLTTTTTGSTTTTDSDTTEALFFTETTDASDVTAEEIATTGSSASPTQEKDLVEYTSFSSDSEPKLCIFEDLQPQTVLERDENVTALFSTDGPLFVAKCNRTTQADNSTVEQEESSLCMTESTVMEHASNDTDEEERFTMKCQRITLSAGIQITDDETVKTAQSADEPSLCIFEDTESNTLLVNETTTMNISFSLDGPVLVTKCRRRRLPPRANVTVEATTVSESTTLVQQNTTILPKITTEGIPTTDASTEGTTQSTSTSTTAAASTSTTAAINTSALPPPPDNNSILILQPSLSIDRIVRLNSIVESVPLYDSHERKIVDGSPKVGASITILTATEATTTSTTAESTTVLTTAQPVNTSYSSTNATEELTTPHPSTDVGTQSTITTEASSTIAIPAGSSSATTTTPTETISTSSVSSTPAVLTTTPTTTETSTITTESITSTTTTTTPTAPPTIPPTTTSTTPPTSSPTTTPTTPSTTPPATTPTIPPTTPTPTSPTTTPTTTTPIVTTPSPRLLWHTTRSARPPLLAAFDGQDVQLDAKVQLKILDDDSQLQSAEKHASLLEKRKPLAEAVRSSNGGFITRLRFNYSEEVTFGPGQYRTSPRPFGKLESSTSPSRRLSLDRAPALENHIRVDLPTRPTNLPPSRTDGKTSTKSWWQTFVDSRSSTPAPASTSTYSWKFFERTTEPTTTTTQRPTTTTTEPTDVDFRILVNGVNSEAVLVTTPITLSFRPGGTLPDLTAAHISLLECEVRPTRSKFNYAPVKLVENGCPADGVGLVDQIRLTSEAVEVDMGPLRYTDSAETLYTCKLRICEQGKCPPFTCLDRNNLPALNHGKRKRRQITGSRPINSDPTGSRYAGIAANKDALAQQIIGNAGQDGSLFLIPQTNALFFAPRTGSTNGGSFREVTVERQLAVFNSQYALNYYQQTGQIAQDEDTGSIGFG